MKLYTIAVLFIPSVLMFAIVMVTYSRPPTVRAGGQTSTDMSFAEFDAYFSPLSQKTDLQKEDEFGRLKGLRVTWEGVVVNVDGNQIEVRHKLSTVTFDVLLEIGDDHSWLSFVGKGDMIKYSGVVNNYGGAVVAHHLTDGKILSTEHLSALDATERLKNAESEEIDHLGN